VGPARGGVDVQSREVELRRQRVPHVLARVVLAERPSSAKPGDEAVVLSDGTVEGFVGGHCAEANVVDAARALMEDGGSMLLRITPGGGGDEQGAADRSGRDASDAVRVVHNPCLSGGSLEVYLEAKLPPPLVLVEGTSPIASALHALGAPLGWDLRPFDRPLPEDTAAVVVATHGTGEHAALAAALAAGVPYVALVASRRRGPAVLDALDVPDEARRRVHTPAGLDIGASSPEEVALSILAEVLACGPRRTRRATAPAASPGRAAEADGAADRPAGATALDPVWGMRVATDAGTLRLEHEGELVWFCGRGCFDAFVADPARFVAR
jgi:xanthine dehydrogenase accessory factor